MAKGIKGEQIQDGTVCRIDLNTTTIGQAVATKIIQGNNINISSTGADSGTGDITVNLVQNLTNTGFEVVSSLPTTNLFVGRKVCYGGKDYMYNGSTWTNDADTLGSYGLSSFYGNFESSVLPILNQQRTNLGNPSVFEASVIDAQFTNKIWFFPIANTLFERSTDDITYNIASDITDSQKVNLFGGTGNTSAYISIPKGSYLRITLSSYGYVYLNMLYLYYVFQGDACYIKIEKYNQLNDVWSNVIDYQPFGSWPAHTSILHPTIAFQNSPTESSKSYKVRITIKVNPDTTGGTYPNHILYNLEWWGGYPAGLRTIYYNDGYKNVYFPASVQSNETINCDINNIEPTQTGSAVVETSSWWRQYSIQGINYVWRILKGLLSTNGRVLLNKMQNRASYINGSSIIGSETDIVIDWRAGANITITPGVVAGGLYPITIAATGGGGGSQTQVDFNITDTANVGYILNKPIDNRTISSRISALVNKRFQVNPGTAAGNYNEGIRIGNASNSYSLVAFGCDASTDTGLNSDGNQWNVFKFPNGQFGIIRNSSNASDGLIFDDASGLSWKGQKYGFYQGILPNNSNFDSINDGLYALDNLTYWNVPKTDCGTDASRQLSAGDFISCYTSPIAHTAKTQICFLGYQTYRRYATYETGVGYVFTEWRRLLTCEDIPKSGYTINELDPDSYSHDISDKYYYLSLDENSGIKDYTFVLDESLNPTIQLSIQLAGGNAGAFTFSFDPRSYGIYYSKDYTDPTQTSGQCMINYTIRFINGNWFISNEVFEM